MARMSSSTPASPGLFGVIARSGRDDPTTLLARLTVPPHPHGWQSARLQAPPLAAYSQGLFGDVQKSADKDGERIDFLTYGYVIGDPLGSNGSFVRACVNVNRREAWVENDVLGSRPLFWGLDKSSNLYFSSDATILAKALFPAGASVEPRAIGDMMAYGYLADGTSWYKGIRILRPGHRLRCKGENWLEQETTNPVADAFSANPSFDEAVDELGAHLHGAMRNLVNLESDNTVHGVFLSGGLDSRVVLAHLAKTDRRTRAITFGETSSPDTKIARRVAQTTLCPWTSFSLSKGNYLEIWKRASRATDGQVNVRHIHGFENFPEISQLFQSLYSGLNGDGLMGSFLRRNIAGPNYTRSDMYRAFRLCSGIDSQVKSEGINRFGCSGKDDKSQITGEWDRDCYRFYLQGRNGFGLNFSLSKAYSPFFRMRFPFLDTQLINYVTKLPRDFLAGESAYRASFIRRFPELSSIPWQKDSLPLNASTWRRQSHKLMHRVYKRVLFEVERRAGINAVYKTYRQYVDYGDILRANMEGMRSLLLGDGSQLIDIFPADSVANVLAEHEGRADHNELIGQLVTIELAMREINTA